MPRVVGGGEGAFEPAFVQAGAVWIDGGDEMPGVVVGIPQRGVLADLFGEIVDQHAADRLVRMRAAEEERVAAAAANREHANRLAQGGGADPAQSGDIGIVGRQPVESGMHLVDGQKTVVVGDLGEVPAKIHRAGSRAVGLIGTYRDS